MQEGPGVAKSGFCVSMSGLSSNHGLKLSCHKAATELPVFLIPMLAIVLADRAPSMVQR